MYEKNELVKRGYHRIAVDNMISKNKPLGFKSATLLTDSVTLSRLPNFSMLMKVLPV